MTEISVGTLTAAWLTSEIIGPREITGIILISLAGLSEVLLPVLRNAMRWTESLLIQQPIKRPTIVALAAPRSGFPPDSQGARV